MLLPASDADAGAQTPLASGVAAHVAGVVHDSLAGAPLDGATVQLVSADGQRLVFRSAVTDGGGAFALDEVPAGRYLLGFLHPLLDSLGLHAPGREVVVVRGERMRVDLAVPPAARIRVALCGGSAASPPAVQLGVVRSAIDRSPVSGAVVEGGWSEYAIGRGTVGHRIARVADTTGSDGRFVLCDVPQAGAAMLRVTRGSERSALVALDLAANGISRRDVYVGQARSARALAPSDTLASEIEMGDGVLRGRVLDRDGARPIAGARVGIAGGPEARTAGSGEWTLTDLPMGTRILEVRAVGYAPTRLPVDVYAGAAPVELRLATVVSMLDTVRVTASRRRLEGTGFEQRARRGAGRFVTTKDMLRQPVFSTSQVFQTVPGMWLERTSLGANRVTMRGAFGRCSPSVYLDGQHMRHLSAEDIDAFVSPDEVAGIEIYSEAAAPPEFVPDFGGCGSVVIWTKAGENPARRWSMRRRMLHGAAALLIGAGIGTAMHR